MIGHDWYHPPGGERVDLARYESMRRIMATRVDARTNHRVLSVDGLFEAGWPGDKISVASARKRVHVNLAKLRAWGLCGLLVRKDDGYIIDPSLSIRTKARESAA